MKNNQFQVGDTVIIKKTGRIAKIESNVPGAVSPEVDYLHTDKYRCSWAEFNEEKTGIFTGEELKQYP